MRYELSLSSKRKIIMDDEDLAKFKENISKNFIQLKQGLINPSHVVDIIPIVEKPRKTPIGEVEDGVYKVRSVKVDYPVVNDLFKEDNMLLEAPER